MRPLHNPRSYELACKAALGLLYAGAIVLVFGGLGWVMESTETQRELAQARLDVVRAQAWREGRQAGQDELMAAADAAWQAAQRMQEYAAEQAAQANAVLAAAAHSGCNLPTGPAALALARMGEQGAR